MRVEMKYLVPNNLDYCGLFFYGIGQSRCVRVFQFNSLYFNSLSTFDMVF